MAIKKERTYWKLQIIGWTLYFFSGILFSVIFNYYNVNIIFVSALSTIILFVYTHYLRSAINRRNWKALSFVKLTTLLLSINLLVAILTNIIISFFMMFALQIMTFETFSFGSLFGYIINTYIVLNGWALIYFVIYYFNNYKKGEIEKWQLQAALKEAELLSLKAQINPHFMFNCLNNLRALILEDQNKARDMVTNLSEIMRYTFQFSQTELVTLEKELEIVQDYINLEKIQFEERLDFKMDIDGKSLPCKMPPMLIQLLVENAIKHGITESKEGGQIKLVASKSNDTLEIKVLNTGKYNPNNEEQGIGMNNVKSRLDLIYGGEASIEIGNNTDSMVEAVLKIPLMHKSESLKVGSEI